MNLKHGKLSLITGLTGKLLRPSIIPVTANHLTRYFIINKSNYDVSKANLDKSWEQL